MPYVDCACVPESLPVPPSGEAFSASASLFFNIFIYMLCLARYSTNEARQVPRCDRLARILDRVLSIKSLVSKFRAAAYDENKLVCWVLGAHYKHGRIQDES